MGLVTLNFDLLTLKLVCRSHVCWAISLPILVFLALLVLELFTMYATDRQTDGRTKAKHTAPFPTGGGIITNGLIRQRIGPKRRPQCQKVCPVWYGKYGSIFIHFYTASPGKATWRRSRSFKVIETGTNRKSICDFLLVFHCNYVPIFYRCRVLTIYLAQIGVFRLLSHRSFV